MYEQSAAWNDYYRDEDPGYRRRKLDELCMLGPDDGANEFRLWLYKRRYEDEKRPGQPVDRFLFQCVNFVQLYKTAKLYRRSAAKEVQKSLELMGFDVAPQFGEAGERALYWELRNAAARYFRTCESPGYRRAVFGLFSAGEGRTEHMCRDAWEMSLGLSRRTRMEQHMTIWNRAVHDSYLAADAGAEARFIAFDRNMEGKR